MLMRADPRAALGLAAVPAHFRGRRRLTWRRLRRVGREAGKPTQHMTGDFGIRVDLGHAGNGRGAPR